MKLSLTIFLALSLAVVAQERRPDGSKQLILQPGEKLPVPETPAVVTKQEVATPIPPDVPGQLVADFFGLLAKGQIDDAYSALTKGSRIIEKPDDLRILKQKTKEAIEVFGTIIGHELVETKPVGSRLIRRTYLSLGSEFPLRWRFYFYNANSQWRLIDMRVDDKLTGMFDETPEPRSEEIKAPIKQP